MFMTLLSSISKIAIIAFSITFILILVELYLMSKKEGKKVEKKDVVVPDFNKGATAAAQVFDNVPITVKKAAIDRGPHQISPQYVFGLVGLCVLVFIGVVVSVMLKNKQPEQIVQVQPLPSRTVPFPTAKRPTVTPGVVDDTVEIMDIADEVSSESAGVQSQAPSPTPYVFISPTMASTSPTPSISLSLSVTPTYTPTKPVTKAPTLLKTGGEYRAGLVAATISFALIAFAFMF